MGKKKYNTEEERIAARKEYNRQYREKNKEKLLAYDRQKYERNKEQSIEYQKQRYQEKKEDIKEYQKLYREKHRKQAKDYQKQYREANKKQILEHKQEYQQTQKGRAVNLSGTYNQKDRQRGFDTSNNITADWIVENIFPQKCVYCGRDDWQTLGTDRIDNSKPHTPDNVVCCCGLCNVERQDNYTVEEFKQYKQLHPTLTLQKRPDINPDGSIKKRRYILL